MPIRTILRDLQLEEVSFVTRGDNPGAQVLIYKQEPGEAPVEEEAENVEVAGNDLYVLSESGVIYLISDYEIVGDEITGTITVLYDPEEDEPKAEPKKPEKPAVDIDVATTPALKSGDPDARARAMYQAAKASPEAKARLRKASEAEALAREARRDDADGHPLEKMAAQSGAFAKLKPAIYSTMEKHGCSWEVALGKVKRDPRYYGLVSEYQDEQAQLRA